MNLRGQEVKSHGTFKNGPYFAQLLSRRGVGPLFLSAAAGKGKG